MKDIKETVLVDRFEYNNISSLLNEILRKTETFVRFYDCSPKYLKLTYKQYEDIRAYDSSLIREEVVDYERNYYILGMKIIL